MIRFDEDIASRAVPLYGYEAAASELGCHRTTLYRRIARDPEGWGPDFAYRNFRGATTPLWSKERLEEIQSTYPRLTRKAPMKGRTS